MTKLVQVPKEKLRAKRAAKTVADRFADLEREHLREEQALVVEKTETEGYFDIVHPPTIAKPAPLAQWTRQGGSPAEDYLSTLSEGASRETMKTSLEKIIEIFVGLGAPAVNIFEFPWHKVDATLAAGLRGHLKAHGAPSSANLRLAALRGVLKACAERGMMTYEALHQTLAKASKVKGFRERPGRALEPWEVEAMYGACDPEKPVGARDIAMLTLGYECGLRRDELKKVDVASFRKDGKNFELIVMGKGNKERKLYLSSEAAKRIERWLEVRGREPGPMLVNCGGNGNLTLNRTRMSLSAVYVRIVFLAVKAGLSHISPHDLRRSFISDLLDEEGVDPKTVQDLAGHASLTTTMGYDRRGEERKKKALTKLHGRFKKPAKKSQDRREKSR